MFPAVSRKRSERYAELLRLLHRNGTVSLRELAQQLGVSSSTLRRDLRGLAESGWVQRSSGEVQLTVSPGDDQPFAVRAVSNVDQKRRIARATLDLLQNGETVFISGGTTTLELARIIPGRRRLTVITNALRVAQAVADKPGIKLVVVGGVVRPDEQTMHGHLTEWSAQQLRADKLLYSIQALSLQHGITHSHVGEVSTDRVLASIATQVIGLADHTKMGKVAPAMVLPLSKVDVVVTVREVPAELIENLRAANLQVVLA